MLFRELGQVILRVYLGETPVSMRINTNLSALQALRNLNQTSDGLNVSITRLSTGLRINSAADDPAGLVISESMRTQILGIDQASHNSQDAINMTKTAEGALNEIHSLLRGMRALAVHSANTGVVDGNVLNANQAQIRNTIQSIDRIASHTSFGSKRLLDGTSGAQASVTRPDYIASIYMGGTFNGNPVVNGPVTVNVTTQATRAAINTSVTYASANDIVAAGNITINGVTFVSSGSETLQQIVSKINESTSITGVTAQITGAAGSLTVDLVQNNYGANYSVQLYDTAGLLNGAATASSTGVDAVANVSVSTTAGVETVTFRGGRSAGDSGLKLTDTYGNAIKLTENGNLNMSGATQVGILTAGAINIQFGPSVNQAVQLSIPSLFASSLGTGAVAGESIASLDVTTGIGAENAIRIIDDAINQVSLIRGDLGSFQKDFLESNVRSLGVARENLTATESQIRDADIAEEMTQYTKLQILQQSGMAVLAQANQLPQSVLQLLRNG
jgi:flagellin